MTSATANAQLNASEISELIEKRIKDFSTSSSSGVSGKIVSVRDGIITIHGLSDVAFGEMIELPEMFMDLR